MDLHESRTKKILNMEQIKKNSTFFVDVDGTLIKYRKPSELRDSSTSPISEVVNYINEQYSSGSIIIITTSRSEQLRHFTVLELNSIGLNYHHLLMGCGTGPRVLINDLDPENPEQDKSIAINITRDMGFQDIGGPPKINGNEL